MAPEVEEDLCYSFPADIWSVGVVFRTLLASTTGPISATEQDLLSSLLQENPDERPSAKAALCHSYFCK